MRLLALVVAAWLAIAAREPVLVPDVSQRQIDIVYSFTGAELLLFGAILYPDGRIPQRDADIVVVLKGPSQRILVREKQRLLGLVWANAESARFQSAPGYYAVASSRPIDRLVNERTAAIYELGLGNIQLSPADVSSPQEQQRFERGLVALQAKHGLFVNRAGEVEITDGSLYRARLPLPARVPVGSYTAETFLIRDGRVLAAATRDITIRKQGFERFVARAAERAPFVYGIVAIMLSLGLGWLASYSFRRI